MIKKRIGTDFFLTLNIYQSGNEIDFANVKNTKLAVVNHSTGTEKTQTFTAYGNSLKFQWSSNENQEEGVFDCRVEYDRQSDSSETKLVHYIVDFPECFQIVRQSTEEGGDGIFQMTGNAYSFNTTVPEYLTLN